MFSLSQWPDFKLSGITCLVGNIKFKLLSQGPLAELVFLHRNIDQPGFLNNRDFQGGLGSIVLTLGNQIFRRI